MLGMMRFVLLSLALLMTGQAYAEDKTMAPENIAGAVTVSAEELIKLLFSNPEIVLIDSRKDTEYLKGHIEGAINILNTKMTRESLHKVAPDTAAALLFYCNGTRCLRSSDAVNKAIDWGYSNVFWFRGGWQEWTEKKLPVIAGEYMHRSR